VDDQPLVTATAAIAHALVDDGWTVRIEGNVVLAERGKEKYRISLDARKHLYGKRTNR
jgi:hypothetical protein